MGAKAIRQYIVDYFGAHAIKGSLIPDRIYEVVDTDETKIKISTRNKNGRWLQTLFADLVTCKSLKHGQFRRVDLFWGLQRKPDRRDAAPSKSNGATPRDESIRQAVPGPKFLSNGELMPVDAFISRHSRKEKVS